jgi:hypothetical protein
LARRSCQSILSGYTSGGGGVHGRFRVHAATGWRKRPLVGSIAVSGLCACGRERASGAPETVAASVNAATAGGLGRAASLEARTHKCPGCPADAGSLGLSLADTPGGGRGVLLTSESPHSLCCDVNAAELLLVAPASVAPELRAIPGAVAAHGSAFDLPGSKSWPGELAAEHRAAQDALVCRSKSLGMERVLDRILTMRHDANCYHLRFTSTEEFASDSDAVAIRAT